MPSDTTQAGPWTARCHCDATRLRFSQAPDTIAYCHYSDCRHWTGAPVAAFSPNPIKASTDLGPGCSHAEGIARWVCAACGSPLAAPFDDLPEQVYVPLGIVDQNAQLPPHLHCHAEARLPWLYITDDVPRLSGSARALLSETAN